VSAEPPPNAPAGLTFPLGFYDFMLANVPEGGAATVTLNFPAGTALPNSYYRFGSTPNGAIPHWYEWLFDGQTGAQIDAANARIVLHFIDGGLGDDDRAANGVILDPGAPAVSPLAAATALTLTSNQPGAIYGQAVTITARATADAGTPSGTVQFAINGAAAGAPRPLDAGTASLTLPALPAGSHSVTAVFTSDSALFTGASAAALAQTVAPAVLTVTADDQVAVAGAALPNFTVRFAGFVNGEGAASLDAPALLLASANTSSPAGSYAINVSGVAARNYTIVFVPGRLALTAPPLPPAPPPATLSVKAPRQFKGRGPTVAFRGRGITLRATNVGAVVKVKITTSVGLLKLARAAGVKVKGHNSKALILTGSIAALNRAVGAVKLDLGTRKGKVKVVIVATASDLRSQALIAISA
jgi:hypothetical protein